ncbi:23S rRNA (pseudouridine(1915)-N(3))-methyltransferase RlmH [Parahaliea aestuarii]|uniref:Ribosomal RNA large subunit methyltransferase H n=1 Tax=Parahaliea aestuarii TaxID=1852021 RepID=A0A5C9A4H7_9GAMM|nr:23S rRNA (pseudouridine(1915)-N(3))-methyltransferase RlmH [Parahaliea aestuarii]TXS94630.1 23S rRNA (pseudouridine(1915)-N(3))-methyltransferase RlmH [Parahaliea aestuarii]
MRLSIVCVGGKMPAWVDAGVGEYEMRLPRELNLQWKEIPLARRGRDSKPEQLRQAEGEQILKAIPESDRVIALDVQGKSWSTPELAQQLSGWQMSGDNYSLVIGGPDGLAPQCLERAERRWSLGPLTLPHPLVRIVLAEQLYRAWTITVNHPYHRD